jgi:serine/threonine protein kinase/lipoprotein NlpI
MRNLLATSPARILNLLEGSPDPRLTEALALAERLAEDMALRWRQGERPRVEDYLDHHPELWQVPEAALELISEEISLGQEHGELPAQGYEGRFPQWRGQVRALVDWHQVLTAELNLPALPSAGESLGEFALLAELGRGAQARALLARQPALANRLVVLKLGPARGGEHLSLARLQHTHIVPLYSVHEFPEQGLRGLCLPYFGGATLTRILESLAGRPPEQRTGADVLDALRQLEAEAPVKVPVGGPACRFLARASYVQAVCWLGAALADALSYAQERGLVHLDLKPANVLLAADGQPMLLDFHLARGPLPAGSVAPSWLGGTPGYMPQEQQAALRAVLEGGRIGVAVDGRADIFSLGLLLCELLGGRLPAARDDPVGATRRANCRVTPGLAALLRRCLSADPQRRYPTAAELAMDLRRHLADLPLHGVANRSPLERWCKWRRRRPSALPLVILLLALLTVGGILAGHVQRQLERARTILREGQDHLDRGRCPEALDTFRHGTSLAADLPLGANLRRELRENLDLAERALAVAELHRFCERVRPLYEVDLLPLSQVRTVARHCREFWQERERIWVRLRQQPGADLELQVQRDLLDLAILLAHLQVRLATADEVVTARKKALVVLDEAQALLGASRVLYQERRSHAQALGLTGLAEEAGRQAATMRPRSAWDHYALGRALFLQGDLNAALREMDQALEREPRAMWASFCKGCCAYRLSQYDDAIVAFSVCLVLAPECAWCYYNRGLAYAQLGRPDRALRDYDRALQLDPSFAGAALGRGMLHHREHRHDVALADLLRARQIGLDTAALHYNLALVYLARSDRPAALTCARRARQRDPNHPEVNQLLNQLQPER